MKKFLLSFILLLGAVLAHAQVTTSSMTGTVLQSDGQSSIGASIKATHVPSGTTYGGSTNENGRFNLANMRVGGPYIVEITYIGSQPAKYDNIFLQLGQPYVLNATLKDGMTLDEVTITASTELTNNKTGAGTNVNNRTIQSIPTVSRGLRDFTKLSPFANTNGSGTSFAGTNNRYNQFAIDGLVNNDVFGLAASGTNGGQVGIEPVSLDAIEQFQINIAPYDVRQSGFSGGGINAVTRSGTNRFEGSVYYFGNNQSLVGKNNPNSGEKADYPDYSDYQLGLRLGGPIIKDKLFFFVNGEITRRSTPLAFDPTDGGSGSRITMDEINRVLNTMQRIAPDYDLGSYGSINNEIKSDKILAKIDWNINQNHKLILRHSYTYGESIDNPRGANNLSFYNHGVFFPSTTNSSALELNSTFGTEFSNNLRIGYTTVRDDRDPLGSPFPEITINGLSAGGYFRLGSEYSSVANELNQDIFSVTDNFSWYKGKHTFTFGTNNEFYKFYNLFVQNIFGNYAYRSLDDFETIGTPNEVAPTYYAKGYSFDPNDGPFQTNGAGKFSAMQLGLYAQDEFQVNPDLRLTLGIRADLPIYNDKPAFNENFYNDYGDRGLSTDQTPKSQILWSPRFGFNWDVLGDNSFKIRGGTGIFTGRVPFVWISNQYSNNGTINGNYSIGNSSAQSTPITDPAGVHFVSDPFAQPEATDYGGTATVGDINITSRDFKMPQTFRTNIGIDKELPWGLLGTIEGIYSKGINNVTFENLNRQVDPNASFTGPDQRPRYTQGTINPRFNEIILLNNSNKGYSYNIAAQLQKQFQNGFNGSIAYTYGKSTDLNSGTSSTAYSNWRFVNSVNGPNDLSAAIANFDVRHRISAYVTYTREFFKNSPTLFSLFYNGQSGQPFSYVYNGDLNGDGAANDLIYIPKDRSEIAIIDIVDRNNGDALLVSADDQWEQLNSYIENDGYLKKRRGKYAERNGARMPFQHTFDFRVSQDIGFVASGSSHRLQISFDILNVGNLLNKDWGKSYFMANQGFELISSQGRPANGTPTFQFNENSLNDGKPYTYADPSSRWRAQIGVRYIFN